MFSSATATAAGVVSVRPMIEADLDCADEILRVAFAAVIDGELVGSNFATNWGSVGFFGPLTVRPDMWDKGIGNSLMEPVMNCFDTWGNRHLGLFTFSHSPQAHRALPQVRLLAPIPHGRHEQADLRPRRLPRWSDVRYVVRRRTA